MSIGRALILVATLVVATLFAATSTVAQADPADAEQLAALVAQANSQEPIYGPTEAALVPDRSSASTMFADVDVADSVIHFDAEAPNTGPDQEWGMIVAFRQGEDSHSVSLWSSGSWVFFQHGAEDPLNGSFPFDSGPGSVLSVDIAVSGNTAYVGVNGQLVSAFDISSFSGPGSVMIASALTGDYTESVGFVAVTNATVWNLSAADGTTTTTTTGTQGVDPTPSSDSYTSPTHGYTIPLNGWTIDGAVSQDGVDLVRLVNEPLSAFVMSFESAETPAACINDMFAIIQGREGYNDVAFASPVEVAGDTAFAVISYTYLDEDGQLVDERDRVTCWLLDESGVMVRLDVLVQAGDTLENLSTMVALEETVASAVLSAQTGQTGTPDSTPTPAITIDPTPTTATTIETTPTPATTAGTSGLDPSGMSYTSPSFGYSLSWDETFAVSDESSDETGDYLGLDSEAGVFVDLIGESWTAQTSCFDWLVSYYQGEPEYSNINSAPDAASAAPGIWEMTGVITMTYTSPSDGTSTDLANYAACSPIADQGAVVTLEQITPLSQFTQQIPLMDTVRQAFVPAASTGVQTPAVTTEQTPVASATPEQSPTAGAGAGVDYTSATFGYTLSWDDAWSIEEDTTDPAGDYLRVTNGPVYADLLSEPWDPTFTGSCFDLVVAFYTGHQDYSDVRGIEDSASMMPETWDSTGAIALTYLDTSDGEPLPLINYVSCSVDQEQGIVVSLEQFVEPESAPGQIEIMNALRSGFALE